MNIKNPLEEFKFGIDELNISDFQEPYWRLANTLNRIIRILKCLKNNIDTYTEEKINKELMDKQIITKLDDVLLIISNLKIGDIQKSFQGYKDMIEAIDISLKENKRQQDTSDTKILALSRRVAQQTTQLNSLKGRLTRLQKKKNFTPKSRN